MVDVVLKKYEETLREYYITKDLYFDGEIEKEIYQKDIARLEVMQDLLEEMLKARGQSFKDFRRYLGQDGEEAPDIHEIKEFKKFLYNLMF